MRCQSASTVAKWSWPISSLSDRHEPRSVVGVSASRSSRTRSSWGNAPSVRRRHRWVRGRKVLNHGARSGSMSASRTELRRPPVQPQRKSVAPMRCASYQPSLLHTTTGHSSGAPSVIQHSRSASMVVPQTERARSRVQRVRVAPAVTFRRSREMGALPLDAVVPTLTERRPQVEEVTELTPAVGLDEPLVVGGQSDAEHGLHGGPVPLGVHGGGRWRHEGHEPVAAGGDDLRVGHGGSVVSSPRPDRHVYGRRGALPQAIGRLRRSCRTGRATCPVTPTGTPMRGGWRRRTVGT